MRPTVRAETAAMWPPFAASIAPRFRRHSSRSWWIPCGQSRCRRAVHGARVERSYSRGEVNTTKAGETRRVDMSRELARALRRLEVERAEEKLRRGVKTLPPWVFSSEVGTPLEWCVEGSRDGNVGEGWLPGQDSNLRHPD